MVGYKNTSDVAKKLLKSHREKRNKSPKVSFIYNGSKTTTWMVQNQKHKIYSSIFKITTSFLNFKLKTIRLLAQGHWSCKPPLKQLFL